MTEILSNKNKETREFLQKKAKFIDMAISMTSLAEINIKADISEEDKKKAYNAVDNNDFEINNFKEFLVSMHKSSRDAFLTPYTEEALKEEFTTYKLNGFDAGFAIKNDGDITSLHNNSGVPGLGSKLIEKAKEFGGTKLDHFDGFLSELYEKHGFEEYQRLKWDDEYAPKNWDYTTYGRPDVVMRKLKTEE